MIALLLNMVFFTWNVIFSLFTHAIFTSAAHLIVLVIQKLKPPEGGAEDAKGFLEVPAEFIKSSMEFVFGFVVEAVSSSASTGFDLLKEGVAGSVAGGGSAIAGLVEKARDSFQELFDLPQVFEGFSEMVVTMFQDFWNHSKDAIGYVMENIG